MRRNSLFLILSILLAISSFSCFEVPAPEVQIWRSSPYGFSTPQFDSVFIETLPSSTNPDPTRLMILESEDIGGGNWRIKFGHFFDDVRIDSVTFWVRNGVEAYLEGYYCEFYRSMPYGEDNEFLYQSPKYSNLHMLLRASTSMEDTVRTSLVNWFVRVREAVKQMYGYPDTAWQTVEMKVHFYGEDAYGDGKTFEVTQDYLLYRTD